MSRFVLDMIVGICAWTGSLSELRCFDI